MMNVIYINLDSSNGIVQSSELCSLQVSEMNNLLIKITNFELCYGVLQCVINWN